MKKMIIASSLLVLLTSCMDSARDRSAGMYKTNDAGSYDYDRNSGSSGNTGGTGTFEPTTPEAESPEDSNTPAEARHCSWSTDGSSGYSTSTNHLGEINVCQSQSDDKNIFVQLKTPITSNIKLCAIPMYDNGSNAVYIGNPRCIYVNDNGIKQIPLLKNRGGNEYSQFHITSVMLIKDAVYRYPAPFANYQNPSGAAKSVDAFLFCMNWVDETKDTRYCQAFNSLGQHVYYKF